MSEPKGLRWIGHCYEGPSDKPKHDKIWGYIVKDDGYAVTFWGRRTANLTFKKVSVSEAREQAESKEHPKGSKDPYNTISWDWLLSQDSEFEDRFHEKLCLVMLGNYYHRAGECYAQ